MKIGVFDSGIGGEKIAQLLRNEFTMADIIAVSDADNLPYGNKSKNVLKKLVLPKLITMQEQGCDLIVIACNTVTTVLIEDLRNILLVPLVGFEPMVKPASMLTKTNIIAVCATPATLRSDRYNTLKQSYASDVTVIEPDCSQWAEYIEKNTITQSHIDKPISFAIEKGADVIVLGCTHYHWIEDEIKEMVGSSAVVIQPEEAVVRRIKQLL